MKQGYLFHRGLNDLEEEEVEMAFCQLRRRESVNRPCLEKGRDEEDKGGSGASVKL